METPHPDLVYVTGRKHPRLRRHRTMNQYIDDTVHITMLVFFTKVHFSCCVSTKELLSCLLCCYWFQTGMNQYIFII
jgi:hypothetical protein